MLSDLFEEVATWQAVHDEQLIRSFLYAPLESDDSRVLRDELVQADFAVERRGICVVGWTWNAFDSVVFRMFGRGVGVDCEVGDTTSASAQDIKNLESASVDEGVDSEHDAALQLG